ncbi:MAG: MFS transporter [Butyricicoccus sp.]
MRETTAKETARIWSLTFVLTMLITSIGGFLLSGLNSVVPLHMSALGKSATFSGTLNTCFTACAVVARLGGGHLCDHWGRRIVMLLGTVVCALSTAAYIFCRSVVLLMVFRGLQGMGYAAMSIAAQTAMLDVLPRDRLSEGIGYSALGQTIVGSVGPMIVLAVLGVNRFSLTYLVLACAVSAALPLAALCKTRPVRQMQEEEPAPEQPAREEPAGNVFWRVFEKTAIPATIIQCCMTIGTAAVSILLTLFATHKGFAHVALFFTIHSFAALFARIVGGKYGDKYGLLPCFAVGVTLMSASFIILSVTTSSLVYYITGAIFGIGQGVVSPVMQKQAIINAPPDRLGVANGTFHLSADVGTGLAGIIWGAGFDYIGYDETFFLIGIWLLLVLTGGTVYLLHARRAANRTE